MSLILSGTDGLSDVDGTAATPAIRGTDANTGIFFPAADTIAFAEGGVEAARFDSSGNFGLGVTPSAWASVYKVVQLSGGGAFSGSSGQVNVSQNFVGESGGEKYIATAAATSYAQTAGAHRWYNAPSGTAGNAITFTQAMTLDASGNLGIGTTSITSGGGWTPRLVLAAAGGSPAWIIKGASSQELSIGASDSMYIDCTGATTATNNNIIFRNTSTNSSFTAVERARIDSNGDFMVNTTTPLYKATFIGSNTGAVFAGSSASAAQFTMAVQNTATSGDNSFVAFGTEVSFTTRGSITYNRAAGLVAYNTMSDYRAKDISGPVVNSGTLIDSVPVYMGTMKGATQERPMFIAHETPVYAHIGEKDAVDKDGNPVYQQMDASALIPVMWAEIQSLRKRLAALESA